MSGALLSTLRAIVREELSRTRLPELGVVTRIYPRASENDDGNHQLNVRLRDSGVELERVPLAASRLGLSVLPNVDDLVLVLFVDGNLNAPVVIGCLYDEQAHPPVAAEHELVYQPPDPESDSVRRLHLELPGGATLTIQDQALNVTMGETTLTIDKDGDVVVNAKGKLRLVSEDDFELETRGAFKVSAQGDVTIQGMSASLEGTSQAQLKGAQVTIAGTTNFSPS